MPCPSARNVAINPTRHCSNPLAKLRNQKSVSRSAPIATIYWPVMTSKSSLYGEAYANRGINRHGMDCLLNAARWLVPREKHWY